MQQEKLFISPPPLRIGEIKISPPLVLAPMAGITDDIFRSLAALYGAGLVTTEMISVEGLNRSHPATWRLWRQDTPLGVPLAVQLFGGNPDSMAQAAQMIESNGAEIIDINAGCPVKKVVKQGAGASLMREPERLVSIVEKVKSAVSIPVTVKMRLGWDQHKICVVEVAQRLESAGADAIAIHGRTASQLYSGNADWSWIQRTKDKVKIPVIANGDVSSPSLATRIMRETGCDGVMIGRATLGKPWIFSSIAQALGYQPPCSPPQNWVQFCAAVRAHVEDHFRKKPKSTGYCRQILVWYSKGRPESARLRAKLYEMDEPEQILSYFSDWVQELQSRNLPFEAIELS
jgi:tRNA-dihydrouridine synthase B